MLLQGNKKASRMLQLWRDSVSEDNCTYSVLAAALEKHGYQRCAYKYCYITGIPTRINSKLILVIELNHNYNYYYMNVYNMFYNNRHHYHSTRYH